MGQHIEAMPSSLTIRYAIKTKKAADFQLLFAYRVELEGIEPSSAQGNHTLSTRLFQPLVFEAWQDLDHQPYPYLLNFTHASEPTQAISDCPAPLDPQIRNNILGAMSRSIT